MSERLQRLGEQIRRLRKEQGISQEQLADKANLHVNHVGAVERGEKNVTFDSLEKIAYALHISLEELFRFVDPMQRNDELTKLMELLHKKTPEDRKFMLDMIASLFTWNENKK